MSSEKVAIFIDGSNLLHALSTDFSRIDIDFELFTKKILGERILVRVYYYTAIMDQTIDKERYAKQLRFLDALRRKPYFSVVLGRLEPRGDGHFVEKGVDIALAVDMLDLAYGNVYDTAIIISGDGDFARAVELVQRLGKHVENIATRSTISHHLRQTCDVTTILENDFIKDCWRNK